MPNRRLVGSLPLKYSDDLRESIHLTIELKVRADILSLKLSTSGRSVYVDAMGRISEGWDTFYLARVPYAG